MRLMLLGYFGFGNAGDEAILAAEVAALRSALGPSTEFVVVSGDPAASLSVHGLPAVTRTDIGALIRTLRSCDGLVAGGGSLLQDVTSARPIAFYGGLMLLARAMRKPVFVYAQGLGPMTRPFNRRLAGLALRSASYASVRDADSASLAARLGVRDIEIVPDPVIGMADVSRDPTPRSPVRAPARLAVSLRPWPGTDGPTGWLPGVRAALSELARDVEVVLVPFHGGQDVELAHSLAADLGGLAVVEPDGGYRAAVDAVAEADAVLGMRLHALVTAAAARRPFVALSYDPKVSAFAHQVGQPVAADLPGPVDRDVVVACARKALDGADDAYVARIAALRAEAQRPAHAVARLLGHT